MLIKTAEFERQLLAGNKSALYDGSKIALFKNTPLISPTSVLTDFTECDFTGYAQATLTTWGAPFIDSTLQFAKMVSPLALFTAGSPITITNLVQGYFWVDALGTTYLGADYFRDASGAVAPIDVSTAGQQIAFVLEERLKNIAA